jgi:two-component system, chemotaxis family, chemotaxis protein CheY
MSVKGPVLVVDANLVMTAIVAERLAQIGMTEVHQSANLRNTITLLETQKFGLIIAEYELHPITGFDLWRVLTGRDEWSTVPFILMATDERKRANIVRFEEAGLPMVLVKPFSAEQLKASIEVVTSANPFEVAM